MDTLMRMTKKVPQVINQIISIMNLLLSGRVTKIKWMDITEEDFKNSDLTEMFTARYCDGKVANMKRRSDPARRRKPTREEICAVLRKLMKEEYFIICDFLWKLGNKELIADVANLLCKCLSGNFTQVYFSDARKVGEIKNNAHIIVYFLNKISGDDNVFSYDENLCCFICMNDTHHDSMIRYIPMVYTELVVEDVCNEIQRIERIRTREMRLQRMKEEKVLADIPGINLDFIKQWFF